jgi:tRNA(Ile)-lysidine synthase TilS/MesJ
MADPTSIRRCIRCILSERFPNISFDEAGVCNYCQSGSTTADLEAERTALQEGLDQLFEKTRVARDPRVPYDAIVAFSGGKDSSHVLQLLSRDAALRCLAVTIDNGFLSDHTFANCRKVVEALGVDHIIFKPAFDFMRRLYQASVTGELQVKAAIKRASAICNSCINLVNAHMVNVALKHRVAVIAGGYLGGQLPRGRAYLELDPRLFARTREHELSLYERHLGTVARAYFELDADAPDVVPKLYIVNPLVAIDYDEDRVMEALRPLGWQRPNDTGLNSTNCMLNDVGIAIHQRRHGFHPYEADLAQLVREGRMSREAALAKVDGVAAPEALQPVLDRLALREQDISA